MDISSLLQKGIVALTKAHAEKDKDKKGIMRGGSIGALLIKEGKPTVLGECHRKAHLRSEGISAPIEPNRHPMLAAGVQNEESIAALLTAAGIKFLREEEIPIAYTLSNGVMVTGRPDIVLMDENDKPSSLLELKKASSVYSVRNHLLEGPDTKHIIQAAHYAMALGMGGWPTKDGGLLPATPESARFAIGRPLPASIVYTVDADWHIPPMDKPKVNHLPDVLVERDYKGGVKKIKSHYQVFNLEWRQDKDGTWRTHVTDTMFNKQWRTDLTSEDVLRYYMATSSIGRDGNVNLGPRPSSASILGGAPSYKPCDYCDFKSVCDNYETDYKRWKDEATAFVAQKKKEYGYE